MPLTPHDEYYHKVRQKAHDKMARVTGHEAEGDDELRCSLAYALKLGTPTEAAEAIEAFVDARMAHHELHEHENA